MPSHSLRREINKNCHILGPDPVSLIPFPTSLALKVPPHITTSLREVAHHSLTQIHDAQRRGMNLVRTEVLPRAQEVGAEARAGCLDAVRWCMITAQAGNLIWRTSEARTRLVAAWESDPALVVRRYAGRVLGRARAAWSRAEGFEIEAISGMAMLFIALVILVRAF